MKKEVMLSAQDHYRNLKLIRYEQSIHKKNNHIIRNIFWILILGVLIFKAFSSGAQTAPVPSISLVTYCSGFSSPTVIVNCGDARLFIGEKNGYIYIIDANGNKLATPFLNIDAQVGSAGTEQGLLGICFHPKYEQNGYFYVSFTDNSGHSKVKRFTRNSSNPNLADPGSEVLIFSQNQPAPNHNGGCIQFGPDGYLYIGLGDGGNQGDPNGNGQNTQTLLGKMLRLDVDHGTPYSIPATNPFVNNNNVLDEIWAIGLRNPWKWSFDRLTGDLWIGDVGEGTWEEVDHQPAGIGGRNYGWRCYEGNHAYNTTGCAAQSAYTSPVAEYQHNSTNGCSITGGYVYRGGKYANLFGHYLTADYCSGVIRDVTPNGSGGWNMVSLGTFTPYQYSAFGEDKNGELYLAELGTGTIKKIKENGCSPTAFIKGNSSVSICSASGVKLEAIYGVGNSYQWKKNNININGASSSKFTPTSSGSYKVIVTNGNGCSNVSNSISVTYLQSPSATVTPNGPTTFCQGGSVLLNANSGNGLSYAWRKNGVPLNGATSQGYTANKTGTYKVVVTASNGCTAKSGGTGVLVNCREGRSVASPFNLVSSPNPSRGVFKLSWQSEVEMPGTISVFDIMGKLARTYPLNPENGENSLDVDLSSLPKGMYSILATSDINSEVIKIILE